MGQRAKTTYVQIIYIVEKWFHYKASELIPCIFFAYMLIERRRSSLAHARLFKEKSLDFSRVSMCRCRNVDTMI